MPAKASVAAATKKILFMIVGQEVNMTVSPESFFQFC
jgi:hypothetical protein